MYKEFIFELYISMKKTFLFRKNTNLVFKYTSKLKHLNNLKE